MVGGAGMKLYLCLVRAELLPENTAQPVESGIGKVRGGLILWTKRCAGIRREAGLRH